MDISEYNASLRASFLSVSGHFQQSVMDTSLQLHARARPFPIVKDVYVCNTRNVLYYFR